MSLESTLDQGLQQLGISCTPAQQKKLLDYLKLLDKWNQRFNLTAIRQLDQMLPLHLLDSLSIAPFLKGSQILDVGSGAGLPGIPLGICYPDKQITLLDSNGKKIRFCRQAILELGLTNIEARQDRVEQYRPKSPPEQITARAFTSLPNLVSWLSALLSPSVEILAMKGQLPLEEIKELQQKGFEIKTEEIVVPFTDAQRHLIIIRKHN